MLRIARCRRLVYQVSRMSMIRSRCYIVDVILNYHSNRFVLSSPLYLYLSFYMVHLYSSSLYLTTESTKTPVAFILMDAMAKCSQNDFVIMEWYALFGPRCSQNVEIVLEII